MASDAIRELSVARFTGSVGSVLVPQHLSAGLIVNHPLHGLSVGLNSN